MSLLQATRPLEPWRWLGWPAVLCVLATLLFAAPVKLFGLPLPQPVFPMVLAYAWALIRPSILAPFGLLLLGLFLDVFWGDTLGLWPLSLLAPYALLLSARSIMTGQSRTMRHFWFVAFTAFGLATGYLLTALTALSFPNIFSVFWQLLPTVLLYPFAHRLIERFEDADVRFR
jgi:rod shape-determining protein MreD